MQVRHCCTRTNNASCGGTWLLDFCVRYYRCFECYAVIGALKSQLDAYCSLPSLLDSAAEKTNSIDMNIASLKELAESVNTWLRVLFSYLFECTWCAVLSCWREARSKATQAARKGRNFDLLDTSILFCSKMPPSQAVWPWKAVYVQWLTSK